MLTACSMFLIHKEEKRFIVPEGAAGGLYERILESIGAVPSTNLTAR